VQSQIALGNCYYGLDGMKDDRLALQWYEKALANGLEGQQKTQTENIVNYLRNPPPPQPQQQTGGYVAQERPAWVDLFNAAVAVAELYGQSQGYGAQSQDYGNSSGSGGNSGSRTLKPVTYQETCHICHGSGKCTHCNGTGVFYGKYTPNTPSKCTLCTNGKCSTCGGTGKVSKQKHEWVYE